MTGSFVCGYFALRGRVVPHGILLFPASCFLAPVPHALHPGPRSVARVCRFFRGHPSHCCAEGKKRYVKQLVSTIFVCLEGVMRQIIFPDTYVDHKFFLFLINSLHDVGLSWAPAFIGTTTGVSKVGGASAVPSGSPEDQLSGVWIDAPLHRDADGTPAGWGFLRGGSHHWDRAASRGACSQQYEIRSPGYGNSFEWKQSGNHVLCFTRRFFNNEANPLISGARRGDRTPTT